MKIAGKPMLWWSVAAFQRTKSIDGIILVVAREQLNRAKGLKFPKLIRIVAGGKERQDSVKNGLRALPPSAEIVAIHDGARPAVTPEMIDRSVREARRFGAVVVGVPVKDTIKQVGSRHYAVNRTVDRNRLWAAQTPQTFKVKNIKRAYAKLRVKVTDDAMAVEKSGNPVKMIMGSHENLKVTTPADLKIMGTILKGRRK